MSTQKLCQHRFAGDKLITMIVIIIELQIHGRRMGNPRHPDLPSHRYRRQSRPILIEAINKQATQTELHVPHNPEHSEAC